MIAVRQAVAADEAALIGLTERLADFEVPAWRTPEEIRRADHGILRAVLHDAPPDAAILVAEEAGEVLGCVFATSRADYFTQAAHAHVEVLAIDPAAQGRGLARLLMQAIERWAESRGHAFVTLNVFANNTRARAVYERLGYLPETLHYRRDL